MAIQFSNLASTVLASGVSNSATSVSVANASLFPSLGAGDYFYATIGLGSGSEIVKVTAVSGTTFTVVRGQDNTSAVSHLSGAELALRVTAKSLEDIRDSVGTAISNLVDTAPATLDTLNELAAALGDDPNFATTVASSIATKLPLAGGTLTGTLAMGANAITSTGTISSGAITSTGSSTVDTLTVGTGSNTGVLNLKTYDDAANTWNLYVWNDDTLRFNYNGAGADEFVLNSSGNATFTGTISSGAITSSGSSQLQALTIKGGAATTTESVLTFENYADTAHIKSKYTNPSATAETYLAFYTNKSGETNGTVSESMRLSGNNLSVNGTISSGAITASSFKDSADATYYAEFANTTLSGKFRQFVVVGDGTQGATNDGSWGARLNVTDDVHAKIEVNQDANSMRSHWYAHTGHDSIKFGTSTEHDVEIVRGNATKIEAQSDGANITGNLKVGGVVTINSSRQLRSINAIYNTSDVQIMDLSHVTYTILKDPEGSIRMYLGDTGDAGNYYDNTAHNFRNRAAAAQVQISDGGVNLQNTSATYKVQGTTVIDSSRKFYFETELHGNSKKIFSTGDSYLRINQGSEFSSGIWLGSSTLMTSDGYIAAGSNGGTTTSRVYIKSGTYNGTNVIAIDGTDGKIQGSYYRVGTTTVIDSSRNLTNIGTISSGAITSSSTGSFTGNVSANGVTIGASDVRSGSNLLTIGGTSEVVRIHSGNFDLTSGELKVGGTTVIDSSRTLTAIAAVDSNLYLASNRALSSSTTGGTARILFPGNGSHAQGGSTATGAIKIVLPVGMTNTMVTIKGIVYEYSTNRSFEFCVGGYNYPSGNTWQHSPFGYITTSVLNTRTYNIRFGFDGSKACIYIGDTNTVWSYPQVSITECTAGYSAYGASSWDDGWDVSFETTLQNVTHTIYAADANSGHQRVLNFDAASFSVGTTTVIDVSRNLTNIGTISSGAITSTGTVSATGGNSTNWNTAYTVANAALPKAGGTLTGNLNTSGSGNYVLIGGSESNNAYNTVPATTGLMFGGANDPNNYSIGTSSQDIGGNYTKLNIKWHTGLRFFSMPQYGGARFYSDAAMTTETFSINNLDGHVRVKNNLYANNGQLVWNAGNDGSTSGLDADLLDGQQGSYYFSSANYPERTNFENVYNNLSTSTGASANLNTVFQNSRSGFIDCWSGTNLPSGASHVQGIQARHQSGDHYGFQLVNQYSQQQVWHRQVSNSTFGAWNKIWSSSTDGSGSGLDADLLDGIDSSAIVYGASGYGTTNLGFASMTNQKSGFYDTVSSGTPTATWYSLVNMAHYGANHGHQIAGSFYSAGDLYNRNNSNTSLSAWAKIYNTANDGSGSGLDADLLDGMQAHTGRNNEANKVVRTDANGYIQAGWINTPSGNHASTITRITASNDDYLRYVTPAQFRVQVIDGYYLPIGGTAARATRGNGSFYLDDNYGNSIIGAYSSTRYQGVYSMGSAYVLPADGTTTGSLYGMAWSHPNAGGAAGNLTDHGLLIINNGGFRCAISNSIVASGNITAYSDERLKKNWRNMPENFVSRLAEVKVGIYDRIDEENGTQVGVSAQSLQELLPEAITTAKDEIGTLSVNYGGAALASAVELAKVIVEQEKRIERLERLIEKLTGETL